MIRRERIRVLIADDNPGVRGALASLMESEEDFELAGAAADAAQAVELAASEQPDVALIDLRMPAGGGIAAARGIAGVSPHTRTIVITASGVLPKILEPSVIGCLPKGGSIDEIVGAVRRAAEAPLKHRPDRVMRATLRLASLSPQPPKGDEMAIGPVQLIVLGFNHPEFHGEIIAELEKLRESDTVRVIDSLAVYKDADGELEVEHLSNLTEDEAIELGTKIGALVGLGIEGEEGMEAGATAGADKAETEGIHPFADAEEWDVLEEIPNDSAAALLLIEHHWAVPLRDAIARAGGFRISDGFISPVDLVAIGLLSAEEAKEHTLETAVAAAK